MRGNKLGQACIAVHSDRKMYAHRANSVNCGNINVSSFRDDYSQQERGASL